MAQAQGFLQQLLQVETEGGQQAWKDFLFNVEKVAELDSIIDPNKAAALMVEGLQWSGGGWNSTTASKALFELTGVPLVTSNFGQYRDAWLYALALHWQIDIPECTLVDQAAAAAFALAEVCDSKGDWDEEMPERENDDDEDNVQFKWEDKTTPLPEELAVLWRRYHPGDHRFDVRNFLDQIPRFSVLPAKPPENNHLGDGKSKFDKQAKVTQQAYLHQLRALARLYSVVAQIPGRDSRREEDKDLLQQIFAFTASQYGKLQAERRDYSVPGTGAVQEDVLFGKDEMQTLAMKQKINSMKRPFGGISSLPQPTGLGSCSFRPTGGKGRGRFYNSNLPFNSGFGPVGASGGKSKGWKYPWGAPRFGKGRGRGKGKPQSPRKAPSSNHFAQGIEPAKLIARSKLGRKPQGTMPIRGKEPFYSVFSRPWAGQGGHSHSHGGIREPRRHDESGHGGHKSLASHQRILPSHGGFRLTPIRPLAVSSSMVAGACPSTHSGSHPKRCFSGLATPALSSHCGNTSPIEGSAGSVEGFGGIHPVRCRAGGAKSRHKILGAVVHNPKARWRQNKNSIDFRLQSGQSVSGYKTLQARPLGKHFSPLTKRPMGRKNRFKECILPSGPVRRFSPVHPDECRTSNISVQCRLLRPEHIAATLDEHNESILKEMEKPGNHRLHIFRRYSLTRRFSIPSSKPLGYSSGRFGAIRHARKQRKIHSTTHPVFGPPWLSSGLFQRNLVGSSSKSQSCPKRVGETCYPHRVVTQKNGFNFGNGTFIFASHALSSGIYGQHGAVCVQTPPARLERHFAHPTGVAGPGTVREGPPRQLARDPHSRSSVHPAPSVGFLSNRMGRFRPFVQKICAGILARGSAPPHKCEGAPGGPRYGAQFSPERRQSFFGSGQHSCLFLPHQAGWQESSVQCVNAPIPSMVQGKRHPSPSHLGSFSLHASRRFVPLGKRQGGLHPRSRIVLALGKDSQVSQPHRHVCFSRKLQKGPICQSLATLSGRPNRRIALPSRRFVQVLRQPALEYNSRLAQSSLAKPPHHLHVHCSPLGFRTMVAPTSENASAAHKGNFDPPFHGMFSDCLGTCMPPPRWPLLCVLLSGACWRQNKSRLKVSTIFWR